MQGYRFPNIIISIHALRGEGDNATVQNQQQQINISIHALRGEGDVPTRLSSIVIMISIHALRGEGDQID